MIVEPRSREGLAVVVQDSYAHGHAPCKITPDYESGGQEFESLRARHEIGNFSYILLSRKCLGERMESKNSGRPTDASLPGRGTEHRLAD